LKTGLGLGYMVDPIGADHCLNLHDTLFVMNGQMNDLHPLGLLEGVPADDIGPKKVALFKSHAGIEDAGRLPARLYDLLPFSYKQLADLTAAVTGWDTGIAEQIRSAETVLTMMRLFNIREGFGESDDKLPMRFFQLKRTGSCQKHIWITPNSRKPKRYYYALMGWNPENPVCRFRKN